MAQDGCRRSQRLKRKPNSPLPTPPLKKPSTKRPYRYDTLDKQKRQIRLFELLPGAKDEQLRGRLMTADLNTHPVFDALSYVWGDPTPRFTLRIDDDGFLEISENLGNALICLRQQKEPRTLWADAICINQQDKQERGHQVRFMRAVYRTAQTVRVWLDEDVDPKSKPFQMARRLYVPGRPINWDVCPGASNARDLRNLVRVGDFELDFWEPLSKILNNLYFRRVWTQQELFLARNLLFHLPGGTLSPGPLIQFDAALMRSIGVFKGTLSTDYVHKAGVPSLFSNKYYGFLATKVPSFNVTEVPQFNQASLLWLFLRSNNLEATDPKDRVYGMLGLARDCGENDILPDYNLGQLETYSLVAKHHARKHLSLDFLCFHESCSRKKGCECSSSPTWLPTPGKNSGLIYSCRLSRASTVPPLIQFFQDQVIAVQGIKCNSVLASAPPGLCGKPISTVLDRVLSFWDTPSSQRNLLELLQGLLSLTTYAFPEQPSSLTRSEIWDTLSTVRSLPTRIGRPSLSLVELAFEKRHRDHVSNSKKEFVSRLVSTIQRGTFVATQGGTVGVYHLCCSRCPAQAGDEVWVLFGCTMPMILRRQPGRGDERDYYSVIGPAIMPGLMDGEACEGLLDDGSPGPDYQGPNPAKIYLI